MKEVPILTISNQYYDVLVWNVIRVCYIFNISTCKIYRDKRGNWKLFYIFLTDSCNVYTLILEHNINITPYNDPTIHKPESFPVIACFL